MFYYVYKISNILNGKIYVGKHSTKSLNDSYMGSGVAIKRALKKYGKENFIKDVICFCDSEGAMNKKEIEWIKELDTFRRGYNMTKGGEGCLGRKVSKEDRLRQSISVSRYYKENPDARKAISDRCKLRTGNKNSFFGKKLSVEHIEKMTKARIDAIRGSKNHCSISVVCVETGILFQTATDAARFCGLAYPTTILKCLKGTRKEASGYTWKRVDW